MVRQYPLTQQMWMQTLGDSGGQGSLACCSTWMGLKKVGHDLGLDNNKMVIIVNHNYMPKSC